MSSPREAKLQLTIYARVNTITGETFGKQQSYAKLAREFKNDSEANRATNVYILVRESQHHGSVSVDYGYLGPRGEFTKGSMRFPIDLRSSQTQPLSPMIELLFQRRYILRDRRTVTLRLSQPLEGEQFYRRSLAYDGMEVGDMKLGSSPHLLIQPQVSLAQVPTLFANSGTSSSSVSVVTTLAEEIDANAAGFNCPITLSLMRNPVLAKDGNNYEETAILAHIATKGNDAKSPVDNATPIQEVFPNLELRNRIQDAVLKSRKLAGEYWEAHSDAIINPQIGEKAFAEKFRSKYPDLDFPKSIIPSFVR